MLVFMVHLAFLTVAFGDVIITNDGSIHLGQIKSDEINDIAIVSFGKVTKISRSKIVKLSKDIRDIAGTTVEVLLKDGTIIKGEIQNYEEEVGLSIKTDFGTLTLKADRILSIYNGIQKKLYNGPSVHVGITSGMYFPVGAFKKDFMNQPFISLFTEINSGFARGLFFGADIGYLFMKYTPDRDINYNAFTLKAYAQYRFLDFRILKSAARIFVPFVSAGAGIIYIARRDERLFSRLTFATTRKNEINALYNATLGLDLCATDNLTIRIQGGWLAIQQKTSLVNTFTAGLGFIWAF
jgi:hypothetical protein